MSIELPGWLTEPLSLVGMTWPEADEDRLVAAGQRWSAMAGDLRAVSASASTAVQPVRDRTTGAARDAFDAWWHGSDGPQHHLGDDADAAELLGTTLSGFAGLTVALKLAYIAQLAALAAEIAQAVATAFVSFGATLAEIPGFVAATRVLCREALRALVSHLTTVIADILERAKGLFRTATARTVERDAVPAAARAGAERTGHAVLSPADRAALDDYTGPGYTDLNRFNRDPDSITDPAQRAALQQRSDDVSAALNKLPSHEGTTYRGGGPDMAARYPTGSTVTERSFMSTSTDTGQARNFTDAHRDADGVGSFLSVSGSSGHDVANYSRYSHEAEVLYDRGQTFTVVSNVFDQASRTHLIHLEQQ